MRNGQNKRMRGRNRKGQNPLTRIYESNGPDVKIRGTASHVAEKYVQLARDAQTSGDPVAAENYYQHAEHYFRLIAAAQEQFRQSQPYFRAEGEPRDDSFEDGDEDVGHPAMHEGGYGGREPYQPQSPQAYQPQGQQPYPQQAAQPYPPREGSYGGREQSHGGRPQPPNGPRHEQPGDVERLPAFITGNGPQPAAPYQNHGPNGFEGQQPDRFPLHRRRRRRHGPRHDMPGTPQGPSDGPEEAAPQASPGTPHQE
ncbi:MAG: DUF4167 domain-containing protein [Acetobacteraceae bacterium]|nr:DUF4167 domain-containing protein [Acetobacteraceae bacterium]